MIRILQALSIAFLIIFSAGCATTCALDETNEMVAHAQRTADEAMSAANAAQATADKALNVANGAAMSSQEANEKIDRAYEKAMAK